MLSYYVFGPKSDPRMVRISSMTDEQFDSQIARLNGLGQDAHAAELTRYRQARLAGDLAVLKEMEALGDINTDARFAKMRREYTLNGPDGMPLNPRGGSQA